MRKARKFEDIRVMMTVRRIADEREIKQADICRELDRAASSVNSWFCGEMCSIINSPTDLQKIAKLFGMSLDELVNGNAQDAAIAKAYQETIEALERELVEEKQAREIAERKYEDLVRGQLSLLEPISEQIERSRKIREAWEKSNGDGRAA